MSAWRISFLISVLSGTAVLVVHLRAEQTRCAANVLRLESEWVNVRRELWELQARAARLRTPERIHDCVDRLEESLHPPGMDLNVPVHPASHRSRQ